MTREETIEFLTKISYVLGTMAVEYLSEKDGEKMREAIKVLEQEPFINKPCISKGVCHEDKNKVLDKIKAEIEQERVGYPPSADYYKAIKKCLNIIDKYKAESEE